MGCMESKHDAFLTADDSVHRMISHDQKSRSKRGLDTDVHYRPRAAHPALAAVENDGTDEALKLQQLLSPEGADDNSKNNVVDSKQETERLLFLSKNRGDKVDPYDIHLSECTSSSDGGKDSKGKS